MLTSPRISRRHGGASRFLGALSLSPAVFARAVCRLGSTRGRERDGERSIAARVLVLAAATATPTTARIYPPFLHLFLHFSHTRKASSVYRYLIPTCTRDMSSESMKRRRAEEWRRGSALATFPRYGLFSSRVMIRYGDRRTPAADIYNRSILI